MFYQRHLQAKIWGISPSCLLLKLFCWAPEIADLNAVLGIGCRTQASGRRGRVTLSNPLLAIVENPRDSPSSAEKPGESESCVLE